MIRVRCLCFFVLCAGGLINNAWASVFNASDCSQPVVQAAIGSATDGDTVNVPAGNCIWKASVNIIGKTITLKGAGAGVGGTLITHGGGDYQLIAIDPGTKTGKVDVSGFSFVGKCTAWYGCAMTFWGPKGWKNLRIHHNVFDGNYPWTMKGYSGVNGLIDHNTFKGSAYGIMLYGDSEKDWAAPLTLGTADFFFIEDNIFDWGSNWYGSSGVPVMDMDSGGRQVFRYNTTKFSMWETHDKARSGLVSANAYEIYNNTFWTDTDIHKAIDVSAGTGVIWGNTITGPYGIPIGAMDYKSFDPRSVKKCDGTDKADQNTPGQSGWRCQYQIGSMGEGSTAYGYPLYLWSNTNKASSIGMACTPGQGCDHVQSGRDYINNGTTPKPGYTPFTYPHPLQGNSSGLINPPTQLKIMP
jgi:hypothetical protein